MNRSRALKNQNKSRKAETEIATTSRLVVISQKPGGSMFLDTAKNARTYKWRDGLFGPTQACLRQAGVEAPDFRRCESR